MILQRKIGKNYVVSRGMRALTHCVIGLFLLGQQTVAIAESPMVGGPMLLPALLSRLPVREI